MLMNLGGFEKKNDEMRREYVYVCIVTSKNKFMEHLNRIKKNIKKQ